MASVAVWLVRGGPDHDPQVLSAGESMASVAVWLVLLVVLVLAGVLVLISKRRSKAREPVRQPPGTTMGAALSRVRERLESVWSRTSGSAAAWQEMEEELIATDMGVRAARRIVEVVRETGPAGADEIRPVVRAELNRILAGYDRDLHLTGNPSIVVLVGVNGTGKTTTVAKLAAPPPRGRQAASYRGRRYIPSGCRYAAQGLGRPPGRSAGLGRAGRRSGVGGLRCSPGRPGPGALMC